MAYLDHAATTPLDPRVRERMNATLEAFTKGELANPSSVHGPGRRARAKLNEARRAAAAFLGADATEIIFTASGSEANNAALKGLAFAAAGRPFRIVTSAIEHECVANTARWLALRCPWVEVIEVMPDSDGVIQPSSLAAACGDRADLVSVMLVNNETGVIQPVEELARVAHAAGALFHTDAVQAAARLPLDVARLGCDLLTLSAHKVGAPRGCGLLYVRKGIALDPLVHGGHQEGNRRAGTESLELIDAFAFALGLRSDGFSDFCSFLRELESALLNRLKELSIPYEVNGSGAPRVAGILNLSFGRGVRSHDLVAGMDLAGHAISAGAACSSGVIEPSRVLTAMGLGSARVESSVRISFGAGNTLADAIRAGDDLARLVDALACGGDS